MTARDQDVKSLRPGWLILLKQNCVAGVKNLVESCQATATRDPNTISQAEKTWSQIDLNFSETSSFPDEGGLVLTSQNQSKQSYALAKANPGSNAPMQT